MSHGVARDSRCLTPGGINHSSTNNGVSWRSERRTISGVHRRSYSSESSFDLSSDSEDSMPVPGAPVGRNIEEIVISDTESQHTSNSQTIGSGISTETLGQMLETAIDSVSDLVCAEIKLDGNEDQMLNPTFNNWPWKNHISAEVAKIA